MAQGPRQLELTLLGGTAHTDRTARLSAEEWIEPYSGVRVDARLMSLWGGRVGVAVQLDRYGTRDDALVSPPCVGMCLASSYRDQPTGLVPYQVRTSDRRVLLGASWQRPIVSWLRAEVLGLVGVRRLENDQRVQGVVIGPPFSSVRKSVVGGEAGVSAQWRGLIGGAAFQYSSGGQWYGVRRGQNRVALRAGYALPLGGQ
jgi:hypothetical protein